MYIWVVDQVWGQDGWILVKFFFCEFMDRDGVEVHKLAKNEQGQYPANLTIVNRGDWLWGPANIKGVNKDAKIYVGKSRQCTNFCFALIHYAWITQPTRFYWLVPQCGVNNYCVLCTVKAKKANKNIQQRTLSSFITVPLYQLCLDQKSLVNKGLQSFQRNFSCGTWWVVPSGQDSTILSNRVANHSTGFDLSCPFMELAT